MTEPPRAFASWMLPSIFSKTASRGASATTGCDTVAAGSLALDPLADAVDADAELAPQFPEATAGSRQLDNLFTKRRRVRRLGCWHLGLLLWLEKCPRKRGNSTSLLTGKKVS